MRACTMFVLWTVLTAAPGVAQVKTVPPKPEKDNPLIVIDGVVLQNPRKMDPVKDPFAGVFFPPELVMQRQQELGLTAEQRTAIVGETVKAQQRFVEMQWQMQTESEALKQLLAGARVDETRLLAQLDRVLDIERQIKRTQIELQVRIKNTLTEAQQQQLRQFGASKTNIREDDPFADARPPFTTGYKMRKREDNSIRKSGG